jgi:hypothetical protein
MRSQESSVTDRREPESHEVVLAEGRAEQAHSGRAGSFSWVAVRGGNGEFLSLPHIAGQTGRLVWIPKTEEPSESDGAATTDA